MIVRVYPASRRNTLNVTAPTASAGINPIITPTAPSQRATNLRAAWNDSVAAGPDTRMTPESSTMVSA